MAGSTGPILAIGAITVGNTVLLQKQPVDWRVPVACGVAAAAFAIAEKPFGSAVVILSYGALFTSLFYPSPGSKESPVEALNRIMRN